MQEHPNNNEDTKSDIFAHAKAFTPREAFESIKPKLSAKYGENIVSALLPEYNKGELISISEKDDYLENIFEKAKEAKINFEAQEKRMGVFKTFDMDEKTGEKAIKEILEKDLEFAEMIKEDSTLLNNPVIIKKALKMYSEKTQAEQNKLHAHGIIKSGISKKEANDRFIELSQKNSLSEMERKEKFALTKLLIQ